MFLIVNVFDHAQAHQMIQQTISIFKFLTFKNFKKFGFWEKNAGGHYKKQIQWKIQYYW